MRPVNDLSNFLRVLAIGLAVTIFPSLVSAADELEIGRRIYLEGLLSSGKPLTGMRFDGVVVSGAQAACVSCHRNSGMGAVEGDVLVPPITGKFLFAGDEVKVATMDQRRRKSFNQARDPYTEISLATAVRNGHDANGQQMKVVMPHYALNDADMRSLTAYLKQLSTQWSPGVTDGSIRFATVVAPGVDAARRKALLDTLRSAIAQKNGSTAPGRRHMVSPAEMMMHSERNWILDVWDLQGEPDTWTAQLSEKYQQQPVFALISGLSETTWEPVHEFCSREQLPCWFPSIDLPVANEAFYSVYFSRGVALEAEVLANYLLEPSAAKPQRLIQVYRDNVVGRGAAHALTQALAASGIAVEDRRMQDGKNEQIETLRLTLANLSKKDAIMFWLPSADLQLLDGIDPGAAGSMYFSGELGGIKDSAFPQAWKAKARLVYPYELPERREANLAFFHSWLKLRRLPLVDEKLQSEAYFALTFLSDSLAEMLQNVHRDYLLERAEDMLGKRETSKAEEEARTREYLGRPGDLTRKYGTARLQPETRDLLITGNQEMPATTGEMSRREGTTIYPRLSLAQKQRFASKGAYIVRFDGTNGNTLVAESDWIIP